jgi:GTP-binding protein
MKLPVIAIVGRPNVGKSTLLNTLVGRRVSVVDPTEGVTRDRIAVRLEHEGRAFELIDTGGIGIVDRQDLDEDVESQIGTALDDAACLIFVTDARAGVTPLDQRVAKRLHRMGKPVVFVANKAESERIRQELDDFRTLGFGEPLAISAQNRENTTEVLDRAVSHVPEVDADQDVPEAHIKIAIIGRQNAGKSTLVNALAREERVIVSEKAGTTRDAVDVWIERDGKHWVLIDTAGFTRTAADGKDPIQWYSEHRALRAIRYCDVAILLVDVVRKIGGLEKRLADAIQKAGKPCLLVANKWDLVEDTPTGKFDEYFRNVMPGLRRAPLAFVSAKERLNVQRMLDICTDLYEQGSFELSTGELNRFVDDALAYRGPRIKSGRRAKVYYATQVTTHPPTFALFVNDPDLFDPVFRRYLENRFRDTFPVQEVPVRFDYRRRERKSLSDLKGGK